jgi:hypothetical protein
MPFIYSKIGTNEPPLGTRNIQFLKIGVAGGPYYRE